MAKGASSRSGPAKDPNALRRDRDAGSWVELPAEGREGEAPEWPLSSPSGRELELWVSYWSMPQAVMWEQNRLELEVALCVRNLVLAEMPGAPANRGTLVKQLMEDLGLTQAGLARNAWKIVAEPAARNTSRSRSSSKSRLKVVTDDSA